MLGIIAEVFEEKMNSEKKLPLAFQSISRIALLRISKLMSSFDPSHLSFNRTTKKQGERKRTLSLQHSKASSRA